MGVSNGQAVSAEVTNPAFLDATEDDTGTGIYTLANTDTASGSSVTNLQREHNSIASFAGKSLNSAKDDLPAWTANEGFTPTDDLFDRTDALSAKMDKDTGHAHDGTNGNGAPIDASNIVGFTAAIVQLDSSVGSPTSITAGGGVAFSSTKAITVRWVVGSGGSSADISANPQIAAGSSIGQILVLIGTDDTAYVLVEDGTGVSSNGPAELGNGKVLGLLWDGSVWHEIFRRI